MSDELARRIDERRAQQEIVHVQWEGPYKALNDVINSANRTFVEEGVSHEFQVQQEDPEFPINRVTLAPDNCYARFFICHTYLARKRSARGPEIASNGLLSATEILVWLDGRVTVQRYGHPIADLPVSEMNRKHWDTLLADIYEWDDDRKLISGRARHGLP